MDLGSWLNRILGLYRSFCAELLEQKESIVDAIGEGFGKWGRVCYRYPYHVMIASVVVCAAMASGLLPPTPVWIDGAEKLYSLPYSRARDDGALHSSYFGDVMGRKNVIILRHEEEGTNILTWKHLEAAQHMDAIIRGKEVDPVGSRKLVIPRTFGDQNDIINEDLPGDFHSDTANQLRQRIPQDTQTQEGFMDDRDYMTLEDICLINPWGECAVDSVLKFGLFEMRQMGLLPSAPEVWVFDGTVYNTKQAAFIPEYYLGGTQKEQCWRQLPIDLARRLLPPNRIKPMSEKPGFALVDIHCIVKAEALMLQYDVDGRAQFEDRNMMWERLFIQILKDNQVFGDLLVSFQAFRSRDDELRASTSESKDVVYVVFTFFILAAYSTCLNFSCDLYRNKLFSALMGFGAAFMGLGAGMGLVSYMGMPMVPTVLICPFLVLGIGVDDMFVVMNCYCVSYTVHDPEERCVQALRISGLGISITTMTNLISFGVGAFSTYMSIRNFCVYSAMALFMGYVFVLTFFFPTLCIDARREECARVCPFCLPDVSDRQKLAQERLTGVTQEERRVMNIVASITLEELVAYKVRVYYEEQAIRAAAKCKPTEEVREGTCTKRRSGGRHVLQQMKDIFTLRSTGPAAPTSQNFVSIHTTRPQPSRGENLSSLAATRACGDAPTDRLNQGISVAGASALTDVERSKKREGSGNKVNAKHYRLEAGERRELWSCNGRSSKFNSTQCATENNGSVLFLTTTIGDLHPALAREALYEEPRGNVGRNWRQFFLCYYGPILMWLPVKIGVVIAFMSIVCVSIYGFTKLEMGLELTELAPSNSYMRRFDRDFAMYFNKFDQPTDIFFVDRKKRPGNSGIWDGIAGGPTLQRRTAVQSRRLSRAATSADGESVLSHVLSSQMPLSPEFQLQSNASSSPTLRGADLTVSEGLPDANTRLDFLRPLPANVHRRLFEGTRAVQEGGDQREDEIDTQFIRTEWWNPRVQASIRALHEKIASRPSTSRLVNPLLTMLDDPQLGPKLRMGDKQVFEDTIYYQLVHSKSPYRQFKFDFIWTGRELKTWRMRLLPRYMATSEERAAWMQQLRDDCDNAASLGADISKRGHAGAKKKSRSYPSADTHIQSSKSSTKVQADSQETDEDDLEPLYAVPYTYMMIFYESDLGILSSVLINMLSAGLAMLLVAFVLIPEARAGFLVIVMICLIDLALFGFMYFWKVKLHMVSTIALVISIGFAVDYSAHLCHTFTHCKGVTREQRAIESLVLMGNPVFHGACSTLLGILLLGFSESFVFSVFFRMMVMVVLFGASHGMVLLPVILSWFGPGGTANGNPRENMEENRLVDPSNRSASLTPGVHASILNLPLFAPPDSPAVYGADENCEMQEHLQQRINSSSAPPVTTRTPTKADINDTLTFARIHNSHSNPASLENEHPVISSSQKSSGTNVSRISRTARRYSASGGFVANSSTHSPNSVFSASVAAEGSLPRLSYDSCASRPARLHHLSHAESHQDRQNGFSAGGDISSASAYIDSLEAQMRGPSSVSQHLSSGSRSCVGGPRDGLPARWIHSVTNSGSTISRGFKSVSSTSNEVPGANSRHVQDTFSNINGSEYSSSGTLRQQQSGNLVASTSTENSVMPEERLRNIHLSSNAFPRRHSVTTVAYPGFGVGFHADVADGQVLGIVPGIAQHTSVEAPAHFEYNNSCFEANQQQLLLLEKARAGSDPQCHGTVLQMLAAAGHRLADDEAQHLLSAASSSQLQESHQHRISSSHRNAEDEEKESRITLSTHSSSSSNRQTSHRDSRLPPQQPIPKVISAYRTIGNVSSSPPSLPSAVLSTCRHPSVSASSSFSGSSSHASRTRSAEAAALASLQAEQSQQHSQFDQQQTRRRRSTGGLMAPRGRGAIVISAGTTAPTQLSEFHQRQAVLCSAARRRSTSRQGHSDMPNNSNQQGRGSVHSRNACNAPTA